MRLENKTEKEKRDLIIQTLDKNLSVEAGAGAGKTTLIVSRIIRQLGAGIRPSEIVAITFTNAATRELKGRILTELEKAASENATGISEKERQCLRDALPELDQMQVSTIHSFCYRILSEKMFDAALPFGFRLMEESEREEIRNRYFDLWAEKLQESDWEELLRAGKYRSNVIEKLRFLIAQLDSVPQDMNVKIALPDITETEAKQTLQPILDQMKQMTVSLVNTAKKKSYTDFLAIDPSDLTKYGKEVQAAVKEDSQYQICKVLLQKTTTKSFLVNSGVQAVKDEDQKIKAYIEANRDVIERVKARYENPLYRPYTEYAKKALEDIRDKTPAGLLTNDALIEKTKTLIASSPEIRGFFASKFKCIYVDEYQDTDHLQDDLIRLLASDPKNSGQLRNGALFVVGDPKQSIYRFRGAEPEVYFQTKEFMEGLENAYVLELSDNYRSNDAIISWVNQKFQNKNITDGHPYIPMNQVNCLGQNAHQNVSQNAPKKEIFGVYRYLSPEAALDKKNIQNDRDALSKLILSLTDSSKGYRIPEFDSDHRVSYRSIRYSDFLVLCMNMSGMQEYADCFHQYGIPVIMDSKSDVSRIREMQVFLRLYGYLASPYDRAFWIGALEALEVTGAGDRSKNEQLLKAIAGATKEMSAYGCVRYLMDRPELFFQKGKALEEYRLLDIQKKLIQMTEQIEAQTYGNRRALYDAMRDFLTRKMEHELIPERDPDAVRFMNLHKAKGLEGNIVIWTNRTENRGFRNSPIRQGKDFYPTVEYKKNGQPIAEWMAYGGERKLIDQAINEEACETVRLEYVAATRAKQALIFMDRYNSGDGNLFTKDFDLNSCQLVSAYIANQQSAQGNSQEEKLQPKGRTEKVETQPVFSSESPSDYEKESVRKKADAAEVPIPENEAMKRPVGAVFGTVMHRVFELTVQRWDYDPALMEIAPEGVMDATIRQAVNENLSDIPEEEISTYEAFLREVLTTFGRWFSNWETKKQAETFYTELPFSYLKEGKEPQDPPVWMHGEADLVIKLKDETFFIIDYKSDNDAGYSDEAAFTDGLKWKYSPQIAAYREAVSRVFGVSADCIGAALLSFSQKETAPGERLRLRVTEI